MNQNPFKVSHFTQLPSLKHLLGTYFSHATIVYNSLNGETLNPQKQFTKLTIKCNIFHQILSTCQPLDVMMQKGTTEDEQLHLTISNQYQCKLSIAHAPASMAFGVLKRDVSTFNLSQVH